MTLPPDIGDGNTAHEKGLHWIRGSVSLHADAVCKMILIQAQAGKVQLVQDENDDIEFRQVCLQPPSPSWWKANRQSNP
jgi:hypothetical protein